MRALRRKRARGFTLIELAIVILISGLMLAGMSSLFSVLRQKHALQATRQRADLIQKQLDAFSDANERLPCPGSPASDPPGEEPADCSHSSGDRDVTTGLVPVKALELAPDTALDGWNHAFTYAVSAALTRPLGMKGAHPPHGVIGVVDASGASLLDPPDAGRYVIVSHGPSGAGAWTPEGSRIPCRNGTLSARNCEGAGVYVAAPWSLAAGAAFFDNIVLSDGDRRQALLLGHMDYCGRDEKYYAPDNSAADPHGCVGTQRIFGACTQQWTYYNYAAFPNMSGNIPSEPVVRWTPAADQNMACSCQGGYSGAKAGEWALPVPPQPTPQQQAAQLVDGCKATCLEGPPTIIGCSCSSVPPWADIKEQQFSWGTPGNGGYVWLPINRTDLAERGDRPGGFRIRRQTWIPGPIETRNTMALYVCVPK